MTNPRRHVVAFILLVFIGCLQVLGQPTGSVVGRVSDANNLSALPGVQVSAGGAGMASTARDGSYRVATLAPGNYALKFDYLGYQTFTRDVTVTAGQITTLDVTLGSEVLQMEAMKVEGAREGQARAINQQKASINLKNVVSADAIGNFPDHNVAESLQRVSGIYAETYLGEARFISIRGAAPHYNAITLDGATILGAEVDSRQVSLDVFPSSQLAGIEVVKAITPDLDADSIGGAVMLKGKSAFDANRRVISVKASANYNDLVQGWGHRAAISYGDVFGARKDWGVQFAYSNENVETWEQSNETNNWTPTTVTVNGQVRTGFLPVTLLQSSVIVEKDRESISGALEKKFGAGGRAYVRGFMNTFDDLDIRDGLRYMPNVSATGVGLDLTQPIEISADGTFTRYTATGASLRRQSQPRTTEDVATGLVGGIVVERDRWGGEILAALSRATDTLRTSQGEFVSKSNANRAIIDQTDRHFWRVSQLSGTPFFDNSGLRFSQGNNRNQYLINEEIMVKGDVHRNFTVGERTVKLSGGVKSRWGDKYRDNNVGVWNGLVAGNTFDFNDPRMGGPVVIDASWLDGRYDFGPSVDTFKWEQAFAANRSTFDPVAVAFTDTRGIFTPNLNSYNNTLATDHSISEEIHAGYLRADWSWGKATFVAGARYERTDLNLRATRIDGTKPNSDRSRYQPYRRASEYDNILPSLHARYEVNSNFILKGAWTNTLARPLAVDMAPSFNVNMLSRTISGGNPDLRATESVNWDLTAEYYLSSIGLVSAGVFYKDLDGPIYTATLPMSFDDGTGVQPYQYTGKLNAGKAWLKGVELSYQQQFRFLPSPFDGLGFYGNYTFVDSDVDVPQRPGEEFSLFKQARSLGNVALSYQKYGFTARLSYTFRSAYLNELLLRGTDTYFDDDARLDLMLTYKLRKNWNLHATANNMMNSPEVLYHGTASRQEFYGLTGRLYSVGASWEY